MTCRLMGGSIQRRDRGYFLLGSSRPGLFCSNDLGCRYPGRYRIIEYQLCDSIRSCIHLKHAITEAWFLIVIGNTPQICSLIAESEAYGMKMEPHHSTLLVEIGRLGSYGTCIPTKLRAGVNNHRHRLCRTPRAVELELSVCVWRNESIRRTCPYDDLYFVTCTP